MFLLRPGSNEIVIHIEGSPSDAASSWNAQPGVIGVHGDFAWHLDEVAILEPATSISVPDSTSIPSFLLAAPDYVTAKSTFTMASDLVGHRVVLETHIPEGAIELTLNGCAAGLRDFPPYRFDLTPVDIAPFVVAGNNELSMRLGGEDLQAFLGKGRLEITLGPTDLTAYPPVELKWERDRVSIAEAEDWLTPEDDSDTMPEDE